MRTLDLRKTLASLYNPPVRPVLVHMPEQAYLAVDGVIEPGALPGTSPAFEQAIGALYGIAWTVRFALKQRPDDPVTYPVMPLEALWWGDDWHWRALIMQPGDVTAADVEQARAQVERKRGESDALAALRLERIAEGRCVQMMHIGPYATEAVTFAAMDAWAVASAEMFVPRTQPATPASGHHEIYLGDPRRADPAKLKTVLRRRLVNPTPSAGAE